MTENAATDWVEETEILPRGRMVIATFGEYSEYTIIALLRCAKKIDLQKARAEFLSERINSDQPIMREHKNYIDSNDQYAFVNWMCEQGLMQELDYFELDALQITFMTSILGFLSKR